MEADSVHSCIERAMENVLINVRGVYMQDMYEVIYLDYIFLSQLKMLTSAKVFVQTETKAIRK